MGEKDKNRRVSRRTVLKGIGAAGVTASFGGVATAAMRDPSVEKTDEVLVGVSASADDIRATVRPHVPANAEIVHDNETLGYVAVKFDKGSEDAQDAFMNVVTEVREIKYAEPNAEHEAFYTPNDPMFGDQYAPQMVNADSAWDTTLGSSNVVVSVVDQGIQYDHSDLDGNMDGSVSNHGYDFVDNDSNPYPDNLSTEYHGTHVGGIAAAETDNGTGVAGVSESSMLSARALNEDGSGYTSDIADAVQWSADQGADVINLSLGGGGYSSTMKNAVSYAWDNGSFLVAAAGNNGTNSVSYPAAYDECLAVSALDPDGSLASYSNYGSEIELCAPGSNVLSTTTSSRGDYESLSGTSMATPVVSGCAGLALAQWNLTNADVRSHLKATAVDMGLSSSQQGSGRVDADNAVSTQPGDGGGGGGSCGDTTKSASVSDSLDGYWDSDCWYYSWEFAETCQVVVELDGPSNADFDLYVNEGRAECPTTSNYDYASYSTNSQETIVIDNPDTSTDLYMLADSYSGSGSYTLTITEKTA